MNLRADQLHALARAYVLDGLGKGDFEAIPYSEDVVLRAPLCPGGSGVPLVGRTNLREQWWTPLPALVAGVEVLETYVNRDLSAVAVEFLCHIRQPACTLRVMDRFTVNEAGRITGQENFFDPRGVTDPGWLDRR
ncbi:MAG TPA: hypothetical protein PKE47_01865 [Verrucomicrobiota bacterium]|nr:hypothetical protein [Verrucomicrobiota bacterium]